MAKSDKKPNNGTPIDIVSRSGYSNPLLLSANQRISFEKDRKHRAISKKATKLVNFSEND